MAINIIIHPSPKTGHFPYFKSTHRIFLQGIVMEIIRRFTFITHATALAQWATEIHKAWICTFLDRNAPGGPIEERLRANNTSDVSRATKFGGIYPRRYARTLDVYNKGGMTTRISDGMAIPIILGTWEENAVGHVREVYDSGMHTFAQEKVIRPFPKDAISWEVEFLDDSHIRRDFAVVGEPMNCTGVKRDDAEALKQIRKYHGSIPVIFLTGIGKPMSLSFFTKLCPYSAECDLGLHSYILFRIIQEYYKENESTLKSMAQDNEIHRIEISPEWLWTIDINKLLSMPVSKSFMSRRPDLHLLPEFKKKFPELSVERTARIAI